MPGAVENLNRIAFDKCIPVAAMVELTSRCDHACAFCFKTRTPAEQELSTAEVRDLLQSLAKMGTLSLQFTGGECLLRNDIQELALYARELNFKLSIFSNGENLSEAVARWMAAAGVFLVQLSLHAAEAELHDRLVGRPGSHQRVLQALEHLDRHEVPVMLACTLVPDNEPQLEALLELARSLGKEVRFDPRVHAPTRHGEATAWDGPDRALVTRVMAREDMVESFLDDPSSIPRNPPDHICSAGRTRLRIDELGNVFPCQALGLCAGNIRDTEGGFEEVWRNSPVLQGLRQMKFSHTGCVGCDLLPYCAPCIGRHHEYTGDLLEPAPLVCWEASLRKKLSLKKEGH